MLRGRGFINLTTTYQIYECGKLLSSFPDDITSTYKITFWESLELAIFGIKLY